MWKWMKRLLLGLLLLVLLAFGGLWLGVNYFDWNLLKPYMEQIVSSRTYGQIDIQGDVVFDLGLNPKLEVNKIVVKDREKNTDEQVVYVEKAQLTFSLASLLNKTVEVGTVQILGAKVLVIKEKDGRFNLERLFAVKNPAPNQSSESFGNQATILGIAFATSIALNKIRVVGASVQYRDERTGFHAQMKEGQLTGNNLVEGQSGPLQLSFLLEVGDDLVIPLKLSSQILFDIGAGTFLVQNTDIAGDINMLGFPSSSFRVMVSQPWSYGDDTMFVKGITLSSPTVEIIGTGKIGGFTSSLYFDGDIRAGNVNLEESIKQWFPEYASYLGELKVQVHELTANVYLDEERINIKESRALLNSGDVQMQADIRISPQSQQSIIFNLNSEKFSPRAITADSLSDILLRDTNIKGRYKGDVLTIVAFRSNVLDGDMRGSGRADFAKKKYKLVVNATGIELKQLYRTFLTGSGWGVRGKGDFSAQVTTFGEWGGTDALRKAQGRGQFVVKRGNILPSALVATFLDIAGNANILSLDLSDGNLFLKDASATLRLDSGQLLNDDFIAKIDGVYLSGAGTVDLVRSTLDYTLRLQDSVQSDHQFPINLSGNLADIQVSFDGKNLLLREIDKFSKRIQKGVTGSDDSEKAAKDSSKTLEEKTREVREFGEQVGRSVKNSVDAAKEKVKNFFSLPF